MSSPTVGVASSPKAPLERLPLVWKPRPQPLPATAVVGSGEVGRQLLKVAQARVPTLRGVLNQNLVFLLGDQERLPWVNGAFYLGREREDLPLYTPTHSMLNLPSEWVLGACATELGVKPPVALFQTTIVSLSEASLVGSS